MAERTLTITFLGDAKSATKAMADVEAAGGSLQAKIGGLSSAFSGVATAAAGFLTANVIAKAPGFFIDAAQGAAEDAAATARLEQALRNAGGAFDDNLEKVNARIDAGQKLAFGDDDVRDSFQSLLAATGDVDEALRRQSVAMDLSRGAGISLEQASRMVGKVNAENVEAFKRLGITIGENATEAEALAAVQAKFAGQSDTYAKSTAGQFEQAKIRMDELKEQLGAALLPAFTAFATVLVTDVLPAVEAFANTAGPHIQKFAQDVKTYWETNIRPALESLQAAWETLSPVIVPILEGIGNHIKNIATILRDTVGLILAIISGDWGRAWDQAKKIVGDFIQLLKDDMAAIEGAIRAAIPLAVEAAKNLGGSIASGIGNALGDTWTAIRDGIWAAKDKAIAGLGNAADWLVDIGWDIIRGLANGITDAANSVLSGALSAVTNMIPDDVKRLLKINSPSLIMVPIGEGVTEGLAVGIANGMKFIGPAMDVVKASIDAATESLYDNVPDYVKKMSPAAGGSKDYGKDPSLSDPSKPSPYSPQYQGGGQWGYLGGGIGPNGTVWDPGAKAYVKPWDVGSYNPITGFGPVWGSGATSGAQIIQLTVDGAVLAEVVNAANARGY